MDEIIGENIKRERQRRAWTQAHLAEAAGGISEKTVQRGERGEHLSDEILKSIAGAFDVSVDELRRSEDAEAAKKVIDRYAVVQLERVERASQLGGAMNQVSAIRLDMVKLENEAEEDAAAAFAQEVNDWLDLWRELGPMEQRQAERSLQERIEDLRALGFVVTAGTYRCFLKSAAGGKPLPSVFLVAMVCRANEPKLFAMWDKQERLSF